MERGVICVISLVVRRYFHTLLVKQTISSTPLSAGEGLGVRLFFIFYNPIYAPHITCKASAHDVRSVSTII